MFQRLDQLQAGSLFILTGPPGAGTSHLAASTRPHGTLWLLDTEGAAQTLHAKPGIHADLQVLQTLSLRRLLDAMRDITHMGKPGDTVILDSISNVFQSMRAYAQQRAGAETDRKASLAYDEHAAVNRNLQAISTRLTELKHAGFHILIVGHLARQYRASGNALADTGLRVLADATIAYEADAVLLVERSGQQRTLTPILKPPRPAHLQINQPYPAILATLYPALAAAPAALADASAPAASSARPTMVAPRTVAEAQDRFFARYGAQIGGTTWAAVTAFLGSASDQPTTIAAWMALAREVQARLRTARAA